MGSENKKITPRAEAGMDTTPAGRLRELTAESKAVAQVVMRKRRASRERLKLACEAEQLGGVSPLSVV